MKIAIFAFALLSSLQAFASNCTYHINEQSICNAFDNHAENKPGCTAFLADIGLVRILSEKGYQFDQNSENALEAVAVPDSYQVRRPSLETFTGMEIGTIEAALTLSSKNAESKKIAEGKYLTVGSMGYWVISGRGNHEIAPKAAFYPKYSRLVKETTRVLQSIEACPARQ